MANAHPPTITALKQAFIASQARLLSDPLSPSRQWRAANDSANETSLPAAAVDEALYWLNAAVRQHAARAYPPPAIRQVAEHIDKAYWNAAAPDHPGAGGGAGAGGDGEGLTTDADLANEKAIASLLPTWPVERDATRHPAETKRYADQAARLVDASERRRQIRERVAQLRQVRDLVAPFATADPRGNDDTAGAGGGNGGPGVQASLATRDGELEKELERMRLLLVRVAGRVRQLPDPEGDSELRDDEVDVPGHERRKIEALLGGL